MELVPNGPVALRLCRYAGSDETLALSLVRTRIVTREVLVARLTREIDTLPLFPTRNPPHCPSDDGSQIVALLAYSSGQHVTVAFDRTGPNLVTNGDLARIATGYQDTPVAQRLNTEPWKLTAPADGGAGESAASRAAAPPAARTSRRAAPRARSAAREIPGWRSERCLG